MPRPSKSRPPAEKFEFNYRVNVGPVRQPEPRSKTALCDYIRTMLTGLPKGSHITFNIHRHK